MWKELKTISLILGVVLILGCNKTSHQLAECSSDDAKDLAICRDPQDAHIAKEYSDPAGHDEHQDHQDHEEEIKGLHGGRLLVKDAMALELKIFEQGTAPHYRVYPYLADRPLPAKDLSVVIKIQRLGGLQETFQLKPIGDFLTSDQEVKEPHSFDVEVEANYQGQTFQWKFESYEGRTVIPDEVAEQSKIITEPATSQSIKSTVDVRGKILPSEHRIAHIVPRFSGLVKEGRKHIGDSVEKGEVLAIVESNQSLQPYEVRSQIAGTIISGHLIVGEYVAENQWVYIVADLSEVWADFFIPANQRNLIKKGQSVSLATSDGGVVAGEIYYVAPYLDEKTQSQLLRVIIPNTEGKLLPGMFVTGNIQTDQQQVKIAVKNQAIQRFRDWDVVFAKHGDSYEIRPLVLGRSDAEWTEVISGLELNEEYVSQNSFTVKADILKSGASHDH